MSLEPVCSPPSPSPVYGPVRSWRYGRSLGVDLLFQDSICSFDCVYCQLGRINRVVDRQEVFVPTAQVLEALGHVAMDEVDWVTFSGNGEPTLALNIGEVLEAVRERHGKPTLVLTNSTWLFDAATRARLRSASVIDCKLDAASDATLRRVNRPAPGITLERIVAGIRAMRREPGFTGKLALQCMFLPATVGEARALADLIARIEPDEVQLNTPRRPKPRAWEVGNRAGVRDGESEGLVRLATITREQAAEIEAILREHTTVPILSVC